MKEPLQPAEVAAQPGILGQNRLRRKAFALHAGEKESLSKCVGGGNIACQASGAATIPAARSSTRTLASRLI